jgi:hypothetical protein
MRAAELVRLGKKRWDAERPLRLAGEAVIGRLGDIATKLPWLARAAGFEPAIRCLEGTFESSQDVAYFRPTRHPAAAIVARRRLASP